MVVFGGEGLADMDDLWIFNFTTERWVEVKTDKDAPHPCARRFHSSCMIGKEFFVVAGCHGKYRCLSDVYSLDLAPLFETGSVKQLKWTERKVKGASFLSRWGHSSAVFDGKIYVFAGRFSSDLNDVLVIDVQTNSLKGLKMGGNAADYPKPRRRHCAGFVGSCMIIFGGFNGEYFNDLHYINVFQLNAKVDYNQEEGALKYYNKEELADNCLMTDDKEEVPIHYDWLARVFHSEDDLRCYLEAIDGKYSKKQLLSTLENLYRGYGRFEDNLLDEFNVKLPDTNNKRFLLNNMIQKESNERNMLAIAQQTY